MKKFGSPNKQSPKNDMYPNNAAGRNKLLLWEKILYVIFAQNASELLDTFQFANLALQYSFDWTTKGLVTKMTPRTFKSTSATQ